MKTQRGRGIQGTKSAPVAPAFTRLELAAVLTALGLLAALALPVLASNRERSQRVVCVNNLRLAGQAFQEWGTEHEDRLPWRTYWADGGTMVPPGSPWPNWFGLQNSIWFHWAWAQSELRTPKLLVCPSDTARRPASDWSATNSVGGYPHPNNQNKATSYLIGLDVLQEHPDGLVAGDRNVKFNGTTTGCSSGVVPAWTVDGHSPLGISGGLHERAGNFLFKDGRVEEMSDQALKRRFIELYGNGDNGAAHYSLPIIAGEPAP
jgi:type II secretory pathway pseudopilin PulG